MYTAKILNEIDNGPGVIKSLKVGVFKVENNIEEKVGEYERNYSSLYNTFYYFQKDGRDFALYSPEYTTTRIMELPSCQDIGGEESDTFGFCPVDFFVPTYIEEEYISDFGGEKQEKWKSLINNPTEEELTEQIETHSWIDEKTKEQHIKNNISRPVTPLLFYPFGFVAGCVWGDDSSWKIQFLDLSEAEKGIIKRDERFGRIELPSNQSLKEAIDMEYYGHKFNNFHINIRQTFNLETGENIT